jgi:hypothetical protein
LPPPPKTVYLFNDNLEGGVGTLLQIIIDSHYIVSAFGCPVDGVPTAASAKHSDIAQQYFNAYGKSSNMIWPWTLALNMNTGGYEYEYDMDII